MTPLRYPLVLAAALLLAGCDILGIESAQVLADRKEADGKAVGGACRHAGRALEEAGFTKVYNVLHGFEGELDDSHHRNEKTGWRHDGLPWEQC